VALGIKHFPFWNICIRRFKNKNTKYNSLSCQVSSNCRHTQQDENPKRNTMISEKEQRCKMKI
jgi:hypothetical protein